MRNFISYLVFGFIVVSASFADVQKNTGLKIVRENGILTVLNPAHPVPLSDGPNDIVFSQEFDIGTRNGDPNYIFGEFIRFAVDDEGCVYVLDWREKTVSKFDDSGKFLLAFGGPGQGPGEFSDPKEIRRLPDGHIMVFEEESQKYACFSGIGELIRTGRFPNLMLSPYFGLTNGGIIAMNVKPDPDKTVFTFGIFDEQSELVRPLYLIKRKSDAPWPRGKDPDARAKRFAQTFSRTAFRCEAVIALNDRENIFFAHTDSYEIKTYDADGELEKIIRNALPFLPVGKSDRLAFLEYHLPRDISTWGSMDISFRNSIKSLIEFTEKKPALLSLIPMDDDYLMVVRDGSYGQNAMIDIFDPSGRFIIEKTLTFPIKNGVCKGGKLYTIHEDALDHQCVKCFAYKLAK